MAFIAGANAQAVGIGTTTPNPNSVLDMNSNNKGFLMPRINDTSNVTNPAEGMMIYNKNLKAPVFHNGTQWQSLGTKFFPTPLGAGASITYKISSPSGFNGIEMPAYSAQVGVGLSVSTGGGGAVVSPSSFSEFVFTKSLDSNSKAFQLATMEGTACPDIEFKFYASGSSTPYLSYKFKNVYFTGYSVSSGGDLPTESISINYKIYGYKDWVTNVSFGYDAVAHKVTTY